MTLINIVTIACLILMIIGLLSVAFNLITKKREDKITYVRSFKKGKGVLIYIYAIPLFWVGLVYAGQSTLNGFFSAIRRIVDLIVLKYDISPVQALVEANQLYAFTMYLCFILVGLNAIGLKEDIKEKLDILDTVNKLGLKNEFICTQTLKDIYECLPKKSYNLISKGVYNLSKNLNIKTNSTLLKLDALLFLVINSSYKL